MSVSNPNPKPETRYATGNTTSDCNMPSPQGEETGPEPAEDAKSFTEAQQMGMGLSPEPSGPSIQPPLDPWKHRSVGMRCYTCMWWVEKQPQPGYFNESPIGRCRRHAPTMSGFPVTYSNDWCGDHRVNESQSVCSMPVPEPY